MNNAFSNFIPHYVYNHLQRLKTVVISISAAQSASTSFSKRCVFVSLKTRQKLKMVDYGTDTLTPRLV